MISPDLHTSCKKINSNGYINTVLIGTVYIELIFPIFLEQFQDKVQPLASRYQNGRSKKFDHRAKRHLNPTNVEEEQYYNQYISDCNGANPPILLRSELVGS